MALKITRLMPRKGLAEFNNGLAVGPVDDMVYIAQRELLEPLLQQQQVKRDTGAKSGRSRGIFGIFALLLLLFVISAATCYAQGPVHIPLVDTLTCPSCGYTGAGWTFDGVQEIPPKAMPTMENYATSQGYPGIEYVNHYVTCPGCGTTKMAGSVLGGVVVPLMSLDGMMNDYYVATHSNDPGVQAYQEAVPWHQQQSTFNPYGINYVNYSVQNFVADTASK